MIITFNDVNCYFQWKFKQKQDIRGCKNVRVHVRVRLEQFLFKYNHCNVYCRVKAILVQYTVTVQNDTLVRRGAKRYGRHDTLRYGAKGNGWCGTLRNDAGEQ